MKHLISISVAMIAALFLAGCAELNGMHGWSGLNSPSVGMQPTPSGAQDDSVARKNMENRTF